MAHKKWREIRAAAPRDATTEAHRRSQAELLKLARPRPAPTVD